LSFNLHAELAKKYDGEKVWGYRRVHCADVELKGQDMQMMNLGTSQNRQTPKELDWLLPDTVILYKEDGTTTNSAQIHPYLFTTTLAKISEEAGVKIIIGSVSSTNYKNDRRCVESVTYSQDGSSIILNATDILIAAGPWTTSIFPPAKLKATRGHSIVAQPARTLTPYVLFAGIEPAETSGERLPTEIYPRPDNTVYICSGTDYGTPLPRTTRAAEIDPQVINDIWTAAGSVSKDIGDGHIITSQVCYKARIREHEDGEEVGPIVGPTSIQGLWVATGHDEWGIQNAPATGLVMSEMIFEGEAKSADCESLHPRHFLDKDLL
jgi:glycine/D-amino acid oxidase-like deaminating enzyme